MNGCLVLVTGISAVGKTKLCEEIVKEWGGPQEIVHLNKDKTLEKYARMKGVTPEDILREYEKEREFVYDMYYRLAESELEKGRIVLLDNPHVKELVHDYPGWRERVNAIAERTGSKLVFIKCFISDVEEFRKRMEKRGWKRDREKLKTEETFRKFLEYEPLDFKAPDGSLAVDTVGKADISKIIEFIKKSEGIKL